MDDGSDISSQAPAPPVRKVLDILVESAEDVPVVEVCLRFAYMGTEALAESHSQGLPQLLAVYKQADYLGMSSCCKAVLEAAAQLKPEAMGIEDAVRAWAWGGIMPDNQQLWQLCTRALKMLCGHGLAAASCPTTSSCGSCAPGRCCTTWGTSCL